MIFATQHTPLSYDYVLVAKTIDKQDRETFKKQTEYIEELKKKNLKVTVSLSTPNKNVSSLLERLQGSFIHFIFIHPC